jgi:hypothetical protein
MRQGASRNGAAVNQTEITKIHNIGSTCPTRIPTVKRMTLSARPIRPPLPAKPCASARARMYGTSIAPPTARTISSNALGAPALATPRPAKAAISPSRSNAESRNAPRADSVPVTRAIDPSRPSRAEPTRTTPAPVLR